MALIRPDDLYWKRLSLAAESPVVRRTVRVNSDTWTKVPRDLVCFSHRDERERRGRSNVIIIIKFSFGASDFA